MSSQHVVIKRLLKGVAVYFSFGGGDSFLYICTLHYIHIVFSCFFSMESCI